MNAADLPAVQKIIAEEAARISRHEINAEYVRVTDLLSSDLGLDALDLVELSLTLEERLKLPALLTGPRQWKTIGDVVRAVMHVPGSVPAARSEE